MIKAFTGYSVHSMQAAIDKALLAYDDWKTTGPPMVAHLTSTATSVVVGDGQNHYWYTLTMVMMPLERIGRVN